MNESMKYIYTNEQTFSILQAFKVKQFFYITIQQTMEIVKIKPTNYVYNKKQMIGKGSFGQVFMGYNEKDHFPVAVKIVSFEKISTQMDKETLLSKLKQQIINMQIAKDQNLVQLFDAQSSSRNLYIICEYCNGQSFDGYLKRKGYLTESQALTFFEQIIRGFQNLHAKKIVHRDLKPANLLMHNYNIKIADLGFSKAIDKHQQLLESIVGTPLYMSPQIFSRQKYTQKTDIWSLGVILYEMLYGKIPWKARSWIQLQQKVWNQPIEFPISPIITIQTKNLIQRMLQRAQTNRVGWQQLFANYMSPIKQKGRYNQNCQNNHSEMIEQTNQKFDERFSKLFDYIDSSFYLESQYQLIKILIDLRIKNKKEIDNDSSFESSEQFFNFKKFIDEKKLQILSYCFYYFSRRNRISYLFKIFEYLYQVRLNFQDKDHTIDALASLISCQLLIIKFAIHSLHKMLNRIIDNQQQRKVANIVESGPVHYPQYIHLLLKYDLQNFMQFYQIFIHEYFEKDMKFISNIKPNLVNQINKQLGGLYNNQIGDYKFVKFMLGNSLRSVFNQLKNIEPKNQTLLILTRFIYEFQKDKQLFELGDLLQTYNSKKSSTIPILNTHDLHKKINEWKSDPKWKDKFSQSSELKIQSLNSFLNKQFKWNPLHVYATDILK